ncbi:NYN domain-containing protein [Sinirhodobacter populi]|uniref:NYN domain-containing protein n=2 Tax=Paenirhodobacter populi TaxID=2306993 RepID=A0A443JNU8_9RHOB|nr:NYN domain-containing protein [Sinirhodobacter populi]
MPKTTGQSMTEPTFALLIDGDNIRSSLYPEILRAASHKRLLSVRRVYGNAATANGWLQEAHLRFIHSGTGKNATDLLICIEALDLILGGAVTGIVLATGDGDFCHLAHYLRERRMPFHCIGTENLSQRLRKAAQSYTVLPQSVPNQNTQPISAPPVAAPAAPPAAAAPTQNEKLRTALHRLLKTAPDGMLPMQSVNPQMLKALPDLDVCQARQGQTWREWITAQGDLFVILGTGAARYVRAAP